MDERGWCVLLVETGGKQPYIFDTAKRREAVGASQLVEEAGSAWPIEALTRLPGAPTGETRTWRVDRGHPAEVVVESAGTFVAVVQTAEDARKVLAEVTARAWQEAPGLDVYGTVVEGVDWTATGGEHGPGAADGVRRAYRLVGRARVNRPHPAVSWRVDPYARLCQTSGLPAECLYKESSESTPEERSAEARAKLDAANRGLRRLADRFAAVNSPVRRESSAWRTDLGLVTTYFATGPSEEPTRLAVLHADGNGLGKVFNGLAASLKRLHGDGLTSRDYVDSYRSFSRSLDDAAVYAFVAACDRVRQRARNPAHSADPVRVACRAPAHSEEDRLVVPALPLVLAGDDLTVIADARIALVLLREYLQEFASYVESTPALTEPLRDVTGYPSIGVSAGVADVSSHFPFISAYELAEELCGEAKVVKRKLVDRDDRTVPALAWSYHVVLEGTASTLNAIRSRQLRDNERVLLTGAPYVERVAADGVAGEELSDEVDHWARAHTVDRLVRCVDTLIERDDDGRRVLASAQVHRLRNALHIGLDAADVELATLARIQPKWLRLAADPQGRTLGVDDGKKRRVPLLDAMRVADGRAL